MYSITTQLAWPLYSSSLFLSPRVIRKGSASIMKGGRRSPHIGNEFGTENDLFWKQKLPKEYNYDGYELFIISITILRIHNSGNCRVIMELLLINAVAPLN